MFWADLTAQKIIKEGKFSPYHVDDMFTPSGYAHVGSLRGPLVHDVLFRALSDAKVKPTFTYIMNDFDPIDGLPPELMEKSSPYLGVPLRMAPSPFPEKGHTSFADYFAEDFKNVLLGLGLRASFLSSWDLYHEGKFDKVIRIALDHAKEIQDIYQQVSGSKKRDKGWLPLQVICPKCNKLGTTRVHNWDRTTVAFTCEKEMVTWAKGCGYEGRMSPFGGNAKLPWKVDWPAHWSVLNITIEGAGKDHSSAGGSRDIARELCNHVFHIQEPYNLPYEFFLIGGKKMSSSKGLGLKGRDLTSLLPASVGRFLFIRTDYRQAVEFDPVSTMAIPDLFDEYDRCWQAYNNNGDENAARSFILSQINEVPKKNTHLFLPRFRDIANLYQLPNVSLWERLAEIKGSELTEDENEIVKERLDYAIKWINDYAPDEYRYQISTKPLHKINLTDTQWDFLNKLAPIWEQSEDPEKLQSNIFQIAKEINISTKEAFKALYTVTLDKPYGPRAGWLLNKFQPKQMVLDRLLLNKTTQTASVAVNLIHKPDFLKIDSVIKEAYPSICVGVALIKGATIQKTHTGLEQQKNELLQSLKTLTTEEIGTFPEIQSYRKAFKTMGIDWHSRRPSPEALLRRVAQGRELYTINTCIDTCNYVVMKNHISVGAFDADAVKFPTIMRFAGKGDEILLLGDQNPTSYTEKEITYYDQEGCFQVDLNYRDAQRTAVSEKTKNIWINMDGIFDIPPEEVHQSLHELVQMLLQYCGGTVAFQGIIS